MPLSTRLRRSSSDCARPRALGLTHTGVGLVSPPASALSPRAGPSGRHAPCAALAAVAITYHKIVSPSKAICALSSS